MEPSEDEDSLKGLSLWTGWLPSSEPDPSILPLDQWTSASIGQLPLKLYEEEKVDKVGRTLKIPAADDLNLKNIGGWTPVMYAAYLGHANLVKQLLAAGCRMDQVDNCGRGLLTLAAMCGHMEVIQGILAMDEGKAMLKQADQRNLTALGHAVTWGQVHAAASLVDAGASVNSTEHKRGFSLLMLAASAGHSAMVDLLLKAGADTKYRNMVGDTAVTAAQDRGHDALALQIARWGSGGERSVLCGAVQAEQLLQRANFREPSLSQLLRRLGLEKYEEVFHKNEIDMQLFLTMTDKELKEVGIELLGPRRKLTAAITRLREKREEKVEDEINFEN